MKRCATKGQRGFTLVELVVTLAILGILIGVAVPRYLGALRNALIPEAEKALSELKTQAWAYYQQYGTWSGITSVNFTSAIGFVAPGGACWSYDLAADGTATGIQFRASGNPPGAPPKCGPLGAPGDSTVTLQLSNDGAAVRAQSLP